MFAPVPMGPAERILRGARAAYATRPFGHPSTHSDTPSEARGTPLLTFTSIMIDDSHYHANNLNKNTRGNYNLVIPVLSDIF